MGLQSHIHQEHCRPHHLFPPPSDKEDLKFFKEVQKRRKGRVLNTSDESDSDWGSDRSCFDIHGYDDSSEIDDKDLVRALKLAKRKVKTERRELKEKAKKRFEAERAKRRVALKKDGDKSSSEDESSSSSSSSSDDESLSSDVSSVSSVSEQQALKKPSGKTSY